MEAAHKKDAAQDDLLGLRLQQLLLRRGRRPAEPAGALQRVVRGGAAQRLLPLLRAALESAPTTRVQVRNRKTGQVQDLLNLASYNYLGISYRDEVKEAAIEAIQQLRPGRLRLADPLGHLRHPQRAGGGGGRASRTRKRRSCSRPATAPTSASSRRSCARATTSFCDQYSHASIVDGAILAKSKTVFFRHNNPMDLERKLPACRGKKLVVVEGVYSMDGDVCVLPEIVEVAKRHGARILIDEAHSTFLFGPNGRGVAEHFGLDNEVDFHLGTFSKSLGGQGGFVCGSQDLIDYVNAFGRSRFFSCNLAPTAGGRPAGRACRSWRTSRSCARKLWSNVAFLRRRFAEEGIDIGKSTSQVMPVLVNNDAKVFAVAEKIQDRGLFLQPVTYPAVPKHKSRLRISVSAAHTEAGAGDGGAGDRGRAARRGDHVGADPLRLPRTPSAASSSSRPRTRGASCPRTSSPSSCTTARSIFSMTVFDFTESMVGPYGEVVMSVIVAPLVKPGERLPKSAFYPVPGGHHHARPRASTPSSAGTCRTGWRTSRSLRARTAAHQRARVARDGAPVAELTISDHSWQPGLATSTSPS